MVLQELCLLFPPGMSVCMDLVSQVLHCLHLDDAHDPHPHHSYHPHHPHYPHAKYNNGVSGVEILVMSAVKSSALL